MYIPDQSIICELKSFEELLLTDKDSKTDKKWHLHQDKLHSANTDYVSWVRVEKQVRGLRCPLILVSCIVCFHGIPWSTCDVPVVGLSKSVASKLWAAQIQRFLLRNSLLSDLWGNRGSQQAIEDLETPMRHWSILLTWYRETLSSGMETWHGTMTLAKDSVMKIASISVLTNGWLRSVGNKKKNNMNSQVIHTDSCVSSPY